MTCHELRQLHLARILEIRKISRLTIQHILLLLLYRSNYFFLVFFFSLFLTIAVLPSTFLCTILKYGSKKRLMEKISSINLQSSTLCSLEMIFGFFKKELWSLLVSTCSSCLSQPCVMSTSEGITLCVAGLVC